MDAGGSSQIIKDTLLYPQGLNSIDGYEFPFSFIITVGNSGKILRSNYTSINNWNNINSGTTSNLNDVGLCPLGGGFVFVVGDNGTILRSFDYGESFTALNSGTNLDLNEVQIINCDSIFGRIIRIAGDSLITLFSTNEGDTWTRQYAYNPGDEPGGFRVDLQTVHFINFTTGWLAGDHYIFKTTNAGTNWLVRFKQTQAWNNGSNSMFFYNKDSGIVVGNRGDIQYTTNGGNNWFYHPNTQNLTTKNLNKFALNNGIAAAIGDSGVIVFTDSVTLGIEQISSGVPNQYMLMQNYPNPFNPVTNIRFSLPRKSFVKLAVYDLLGREIEVLVNQELAPATYNFDWDASIYASGVYFYKIKTEEFSDSKKMVLIK
jgi:photosystem II stability/assembly factor-like uncharacterized protein